LMSPPPGECNTCHIATQGGTDRVIHEPNPAVPLKTPQLRNVYQKLLFNNAGPQSIDGFGLNHDGSVATFAEFFSSSNFASYSAQQKTDMAAFDLAFDTGIAPAVGYTRTITSANVGTTAVQSDWTLLQNQAAAANVDLIAKGTINGQVHGLLYSPSANLYVT